MLEVDSQATGRRGANVLPESLCREISWEQYLATPRLMGWIYEYIEGTMYVRPCSAVVPLTLELDELTVSDEPPSGITMRPVTADDEESLVTVFRSAFRDTADYSGYPEEDVERYARESLRGHFESHHGRRLDASRLAESGGGVVGTVLVREFRLGVLLDMVFVDAAAQGRGIASALLATVASELRRNGVERLHSALLLANAPSLAWHLSCGFREVPNLQVLRMRCQNFDEEVRRHRELGDADGEELARLARHREGWAQMCDLVQEMAGGNFDVLYPRFF